MRCSFHLGFSSFSAEGVVVLALLGAVGEGNQAEILAIKVCLDISELVSVLESGEG